MNFLLFYIFIKIILKNKSPPQIYRLKALLIVPRVMPITLPTRVILDGFSIFLSSFLAAIPKIIPAIERGKLSKNIRNGIGASNNRDQNKNDKMNAIPIILRIIDVIILVFASS